MIDPVLDAAGDAADGVAGSLADAASKTGSNVKSSVTGAVSDTVASISESLRTAAKQRRLPRRRHRGMPSMDLSTDPTSMTELVDLAKANGVAGSMDIDEHRIRCTACGAHTAADRMERLWLHRFEGATNPDDMSTVSALRCPECSTVGLLITGYGPNATPEESEVIVQLRPPLDASGAPFLSKA